MARPPSPYEDRTHAQLVATAHALRRAVRDEDQEQVHGLLCRLRSELVPHVRDERPQLASTRASAGAVVLDGQRRLLHLVDDALLGLGDDSDGCTCLVRAIEIDVALRRLVRLEATVLDHPAPTASEDA